MAAEISVDLNALAAARGGLNAVIDSLGAALTAFGGSQDVPQAAFGKLGKDFAAVAAQVHDEVQSVVTRLTQAQQQFDSALGTTGASISGVSAAGRAGYDRIRRGVDDIETRTTFRPSG
jgi:hypothetical protein